MINNAIQMMDRIITAIQKNGLRDAAVISRINDFRRFLEACGDPLRPILTGFDSTIPHNDDQQKVLEWFDSMTQSFINRKEAITDSLHAARNGNLSFIQAQLKQGVNDLLDARDEDGNTALMLAIMNKHDRMVDEILEHTPPGLIEKVLSQRNNSGFTPLMLITCLPSCIYIVNDNGKKETFCRGNFDMVQKTANVYQTILKHIHTNESLRRLLNAKREGMTMMQMAEKEDGMVDMIRENTPSGILGDVLSEGDESDKTAHTIWMIPLLLF